MKAVVLLSGGLDSTTALAQALDDGAKEILALNFSYGSKHQERESQAAAGVFNYYREFGLTIPIHLKCVDLNPTLFAGSNSSLLRGESVSIPDEEYHDPEKESPSSTVVPFRNALLISNAVAIAASRKYDRVYVAVHATDAQGFAYPDCTPEFIGAMVAATYIGSHRLVRLHVPYLWLTKSEIITRAAELQAPLHLTWSCYRGGAFACGSCPTCKERIKAFTRAGYFDPIKYVIPMSYPLGHYEEWPTLYTDRNAVE